jgi:CRISPR-associated endonuclease Cas2
MAKQSKILTCIDEVLLTISELSGMLPLPFETPYDWARRLRTIEPKSYYDQLFQLQRQGKVAVTQQADKKFIQLTRKGELAILLLKAGVQKQDIWDGKWRLVIFDIPADRLSNKKRDQLRRLLIKHNFYKLQASVFVNPYPFNHEAVRYLQDSKLIKYIRMLRVDEFDNDEDLRKHFKLR